MKRTILTITAIVCASGCATDPVPTNAATPIPQNRIIKAGLTKAEPGTGSIIVKRDSGLNSVVCTFRLYLNGAPFADIDTGEKVQIYVKPGDYIVGSAGSGLCYTGHAEASFSLAAGQTRVYRVGSAPSGEIKLQPTAF